MSWIVLALTTVLAALLGWIAAGRVLRPLRTITQTARTISAGNLHQRLALTGPDDEFKQLGDTLDDLLARLEASFESQRRFVANASHELRTPLTVERTVLQVALADPDSSAETLRATCEELLVANAEHAHLLDALLTLAASERRPQGAGNRLIWPKSPSASWSARRAEIDKLGIELQVELGPATTRGDRGLVQRLIANLVDNAVRYNAPAGRIEVRTEQDAGRAIVAIANAGPVVPQDQIPETDGPLSTA